MSKIPGDREISVVGEPLLRGTQDVHEIELKMLVRALEAKPKSPLIASSVL